MTNEPFFVPSYIVSSTTFLLRPHISHDKIHTIIYDKQGKIMFADKPLKIIRSTCRMHGTTFTAIQRKAKLFFGNARHKLPILLTTDYGNPCIFFPLFSPHSPNNAWINLHAITNIKEVGEETIVTLSISTEVTLPIHYKSFNQQYVRAMMYYKYLVHQRSQFKLTITDY